MAAEGVEGRATVHIDAPPEKVYAMVSDVTRMGEWSPETHTCRWIDGATGPAVAATWKAPRPKAARRDVGRSGSSVHGEPVYADAAIEPRDEQPHSDLARSSQ